MTSIAVILGTRAEFLKCVPLLQHFQRMGMHHHVVHTGQNDVSDLVEKFDIRTDNFVTLKSFQGVSVNLLNGLRRTPALVLEIRRTLGMIQPKCAVFHGDTATTFAASLASGPLKCQTAHIEAGLRSHSILEPFPEEGFRTLVDRRSDLLFAPSKMAVANLIRERVRGEVVFSGNTICDLLTMVVQRLGGRTRQDQFVLMTSHRYENIFSRSRLKRVLDILGLCRLPVYWPLHRMTETQLRRFGMLDRVRKMNIRILPPLSYEDFISLMLRCDYVITDGGSIEEETIILGKPSVLLRKKTERGEGLGMGLTFLTGLDRNRSEKIIRVLEAGYIPSRNSGNPYVADGSPTKLIAESLQRRFG